LPYLGDTPRLVQTTDREVINNAVDVHNERLQNQVQEWAQLYPDADFLYVDIGEYMKRAQNEPAKYGFTNTTEACIDVKLPMYSAFSTSPFANNFVLRYAQVLQYRDASFAAGDSNYHVCDTPDSYLFWDEIHPNSRAHGLLAFEVCNAMKDHGYQASCKNPIE
jgi:phospholipase/lecithinase/hemolysin